MLARVALDPNILSEDLGHDRARVNVAHRELAKLLMQHGVVVQEDANQLRRLIQEMPQQLKKWWSEADKAIYREVAPSPSPLGLGQIETEIDLDKHWGKKAQVAIVEPVRAASLGVPDDDAHHDTAGGIEVVRFDIVRGSPTFQSLESLSGLQIPPNTDRAQIWHDRFRLLAMSAEFLTICDRYAGAELLDKRNDSGLYWLLQQVDGCRKTKVHILTAVRPYDELSRVQKTFERMACELRQGGIREIKLTLAPDEVFKVHAHDRHIRFDHHAFDMSKGVSIFANKRTDQGYLLSRFDDSSARIREKTIRDNAPLRDHLISTRDKVKEST
jgi:hypothetical protein